VVRTVKSGSGGRPRLQWRILTHPLLALDGRRRPPWRLYYSLFHLWMTDAPLGVKCNESTTDRGKRAPLDQRGGRDVDGQARPEVNITGSYKPINSLKNRDQIT